MAVARLSRTFSIAMGALIVSGWLSGAGALADDLKPRLMVAGSVQDYEVSTRRCVQARAEVRDFVANVAGDRPESVRVLVAMPPAYACRRTVAAGISDAGVGRSNTAFVLGRDRLAHVRVERLTAQSTECYVPHAPNFISANDNSFDPALGCSTMANFGSMVADPHDLFAGHERIRSEGEPAASAVAAQRRLHDVGAETTSPSKQHLKTTEPP
jgi:type IV pilus biogenesis protein CpaD/CtpE